MERITYDKRNLKGGRNIYEAIKKLADYEDLEEQGLLIHLLLKTDDKIYVKRRGNAIVEKTIEEILISGNKIMYCYDIDYEEYDYATADDFGKTVFLSKEEAEKVLKEMEKQ